MRRIISIFKRDFKSGTREFLILYLIIIPLILSIGLRFFLPKVNNISVKFALDKGISNEVREVFEKYGKVELFNSRESIDERVSKIDDIIGITQNTDGEYTVILEGNEEEGSKFIAYGIINKIQGKSSQITFNTSDIGVNMSPIAVYGASSVILMAIILSGIVIGLNIVEEKESKTISALNVTPMGRMEFILGKSIIGFLFPVIEAILILWILDLEDVNILMIVFMTIVSSFIAIIMGFLMGVLSNNQISAIANMKLLLIIVSASFIGAIVLSPKMQIFLYWSPIYWSIIGLVDIIVGKGNWRYILYYSVWILSLTAGIFFILRKKIVKGLI